MFENNRDYENRGGGKKGLFLPPLTNFNILPKYRTYKFKVPWAWRYTQWPIKKKKIPVRNFYALLYPFEVKKGPTFELFLQKNSKSVIFDPDQFFFFFNCITLVKNVTQQIFDKRLCCLICQFLFGQCPFFYPFLVFFAPFSRTCIKELISCHFWSNAKKIVF